MEPSSEFLELLREIRDNQLELLGFTKEWREEADRRYEKWDQEWKEEVAKAAPGRVRWEEGNELYLKEAKIYPRIRIGLLVIRLMTIVMLGIIAAAVWLK